MMPHVRPESISIYPTTICKPLNSVMTITPFCPSIPTFFPSVTRCAAGTTESTRHVNVTFCLVMTFRFSASSSGSYRQSRNHD